MSTFSKIILILILVFIDQISKYWILSFLELGESFNLLPFLDLTLIFNSGIAFGLLDNLGNLGSWLLYLLVTGIIIYFTYLTLKAESKTESLIMLLILSGGLGNVIDRTIYGYVVDFIHFNFNGYSFYVFNFADSLITVGAILYIWFFFIRNKDETITS
ncbi:MAG: signal peptidase II [Pseudomonadota bacterium]|nr:signal peptidase II [Pseudomonadota bacterium]